MSVEANVPIPGKNKYIVWDEVQNKYVGFSIRLGEVQTGNFLEILAAPAVRKEGFISYKKQVFKLSIHDLLRNHVNVNQPYIRLAGTDNSRSNALVGNTTTGNTHQFIVGEGPGDELDKESSVHWEEQINTLYNIEDQEEGWELAPAS